MTSHIARHTLYNLLGGTLPLLVSLVTVPIFLYQIGESRFGVLAIIWVFLGYFGVLDMGLSRATANQIARLHDAPAAERQAVFWTALFLNGALGGVGVVCVLGFGDFLISHFFSLPADLRAEALAALPWMALAVPVSILTGILNGTLEARGEFFRVNLLQVLGGISFQLVPLAVALLVGPNLALLIPAAVLARIALFVPVLVLACRALDIAGPGRPTLRWIRPLLQYGGWVTVANLLSPLFTALDQLLIGAILGAKEAAWYNVPMNLAWRLSIVPVSLVRVLFPEFSKVNDVSSVALADRSVRFAGAAFVVPVVIAMIGLKPFLIFWLGVSFAYHAAPVGVILIVGVWLNSLAYAPFARLQAQGRPDIVAKILTVELIPFVLTLWLAIEEWGLMGAACTWTGRILVDTGVFLWVGRVSRQSVLALWPACPMLLAAWHVATFMNSESVWYWLAGVALVMLSCVWALRLEPRIGEEIGREARYAASSLAIWRKAK